MKRNARGFTLVEVIISSVIVSLILGATMSVVGLAGKAMATPNDRSDQARTARQAVEEIVRDLSEAQSIVWKDETDFAIVVPDRNNDGAVETVQYIWKGSVSTPGPLYKSVNGGAAIEVLSTCSDFASIFDVRTASETSATTTDVEGPEVLLAHFPDGPIGTSYEVVGDNQPLLSLNDSRALYVDVLLPADAVSWRPTRYKLTMSRDAAADNTLGVRLRRSSGGAPGTADLASWSVDESALTVAMASVEFAVPAGAAATTVFGPNEGLWMVFRREALLGTNNAARLKVKNKAVGDARQQFALWSGGKWIVQSSGAAGFELYGRVTTRRAGTATFSQARSVALRIGTANGEVVRSGTELFQRPEYSTTTVLDEVLPPVKDPTGLVPGLLDALLGGGR